MDPSIFFNGWNPIIRTLVLGASMYVALVMLLRLYGNRSLSKMNAFDFVVTIAIGSALSSAITSTDVSLAQGVTALATLLTLSLILSWISSRSPRLESIIKGDPTLLLHRGRQLRRNMLRHRVSEEDLLAAIRKQNHGSLQEIEAVILENDGSFAVIPRGHSGNRSALESAVNPPTGLAHPGPKDGSP